MNTLTHEQAELFRRIRPDVLAASNLLLDRLAGNRTGLSSACPHNDEFDARCPVYQVDKALDRAIRAAELVAELLDAALERGPAPLAR